MNERIKELALLANPASREIYESSNWKYNCAAWSAQDVEKFAELIVKECIGIVEPTSHHQAFAQGYMGGVDGLDLLYGKVKQIKEDFGVEE